MNSGSFRGAQMFAEAARALPTTGHNMCSTLRLAHFWSLADALSLYETIFTSDEMAREFRSFVDSGVSVFKRDNLNGHVTASSWIVSTDNSRVLLTHHRKLMKWVQLGGHADGDQLLPRVALREAHEESGLQDLQVFPGIFYLEKYAIPAYQNVAAHWHYDVCFLIRCIGSEDYRVSDESIELAWRNVFDLARDDQVEQSLRVLSERWIRYGCSGSSNEITHLVGPAGHTHYLY